MILFIHGGEGDDPSPFFVDHRIDDDADHEKVSAHIEPQQKQHDGRKGAVDQRIFGASADEDRKIHGGKGDPDRCKEGAGEQTALVYVLGLHEEVQNEADRKERGEDQQIPRLPCEHVGNVDKGEPFDERQ